MLFRSELKGGPPPQVDDYFYKFYQMVKDANMENRIIPIRGDSSYTLGIHDDQSLDMVFIDGDHSYEGCFNDLKTVWPKVKNGKPILVHDCSDGSEVAAAVRMFCTQMNAPLKTFGPVTTMVIIKKVSYIDL